MGRKSKRALALARATEAAEKKARLSRSVEARKKRQQRMRANWESQLKVFESFEGGLCNEKGKQRTFEENKMLLLALQASLRRRLERGEANISWRSIEDEVARDFHVGHDYIPTLRKGLFDDGNVFVFGGEKRGSAAVGAKESERTKLTREIMSEITTFIDDTHSTGKAVTRRSIRAMLFERHNMIIHPATITRAVRRLGLSYSPISTAKRTHASYRVQAIKDYLVSLDKYCREMEGGESNCVFVFTDESYINVNHAQKNSFLPTDKEKDPGISRKSGKGRRLIILHAITEDGPLVERIDGIPVDDLKWKGDTPHPEERGDGKKTAEALWMANSHSGDYHDNMNSDMFMQWVRRKLVPTFEILYPHKVMVLVADNAPYHHKRIIGSLASVNKKNMVEMMVEHGVEYLDLPLVSEAREELAASESEDNDVQDRGDCVRIDFESNNQLKRASASDPRIASLEELKISFVTWCQEEKPELLECQVEKYMKDKGHKILWTPPYCPELQPIEKFWAAGKNHVRLRYCNGIKMKEVVKYLREGWYGNGNKYVHGHPFKKLPVSCQKLWRKCKNVAGTKFVGLCGGLSGTIGHLIVDPDYVDERVALPIDTLVQDLTSEMEIDGDTHETGDM